MGSIHNMRILRFLLVLSVVVLTIFIYASYSSNTSLAPPHIRAAGTPTAAAYSQQQWQQQQQSQQHQHQPAHNRTAANSNEALHASNNSSGGGGGGGNAEQQLHVAAPHVIAKVNKKAAAQPALANNVIYARKQHREPTIDEDAVNGVAAGGANALDDVPDEAALERFVNNDLLEEQYVQNVDNTMGNINNANASAAAAAVAQSTSSQQQKQQQQQALEQQPQQEQANAQQQEPQTQEKQPNQLVDNANNNNLNKILDSDVLIPTSNLQKFIENADKILKNITAVPPPSAAAGEKSAEKDTPSVVKTEDTFIPQQHPSDIENINNNLNNNVDNNIDDDVALPPSVVMTIKRGSQAQPPAAAAPASASAAAAPPAPPIKTSKPKVTPKSNNATAAHVAIDPTQGIPTQQIYESGHMNEELNIDKICPNEGADLKLLILITSAQAHDQARLAIRQTWAHYGTRRDVSTAFILGRTTNETLNVALSQENFIYGDLIRGNFIDSYNNLTLKTISALEWVDTHCARAKYVLKTDDDMFINVPKLLTFLDNHAKEKRVIYGRLAKKWKPIRNKKSKYYVSTGQFSAPVFPPFTTGPAYVMSSDIIHELYIRSLHQVYLKLEDVFTTGIVAQQLNIKRVHVNEFLNRRIAFNPCNIRKTISVHMIKSNEQFDLWKKLLDQTTKCK